MNRYLAFLAIIVMGCNNTTNDKFMGISVNELEEATIKHLKDWFPVMIDSSSGGYLTNMEYNWEVASNQDKMLVTQARCLWTASKAASAFNDNPVYRDAAEHGFNFMTNTLWDKERGGFRLNYQAEQPDKTDEYNLMYANSFALFGLAEYAKVSKRNDVLAWVDRTFRWIDSVSYDHEHGGYFNLLVYEGSNKNINVYGWENPEWKDQNTSIHLLEAFTVAYQVLPEPNIRKRLEEMLVLVRDTMVQPDGSLKLFFTRDWQPIDYSDSSRQYVLEHHNTDHVSFGHNIETAYLLIDASKALYGEVDEITLTTAKQLTDHTLKHGFAPGFYGLYDRGYNFEGKGFIEITDQRKAWWAQFEAWHTLALMGQYFPDEKVYHEAFVALWTYINKELLDHEHGGYYNYGLDSDPNNKLSRKAHAWKGPYHDGRALILVGQYARQQFP